MKLLPILMVLLLGLIVVSFVVMSGCIAKEIDMLDAYIEVCDFNHDCYQRHLSEDCPRVCNERGYAYVGQRFKWAYNVMTPTVKCVCDQRILGF